ncbi:MarC family protein [Sulfolobus sp. S-194]|uniref:MarC family protein n=1 Tax=Sulfolobus sp. S-194 TaxID=2512240 RepID=UPI0014373AD4|nr:MarC family protein [Sulfolobus sp. S-194]QIW24353.1 MarC family protein [Sulfolobus sp. S-194]
MSSLDAIAVITVKLFAIIDPFSVLPYLLAVYEEAIKEGSDKKVSWNFIVNKITIAIIILLIIFSVLGRPLLDFLGISPQALEIAGGILLVYLGVDTMGGFQQLRFIRKLEEAIITPIATPLLVGPGTMTALITLSVSYSPLILIISSLIVSFLVYLSLLTGPFIVKALGETGTVAAGRFTAIIIAAFGVQLILQGISQLKFA